MRAEIWIQAAPTYWPDNTSNMASIERTQDESESLRFLISLAAGRQPTRLPTSTRLSALCIDHRMQGLVMSTLDSIEDVRAAGLREELASIDGQTWARHVFLAAELARVSSSLTERGIGHYLIKGLAVERRFYDRTGERPSADLDLVLMPGSPVEDALEVLEDDEHDHDVIGRLANDGWIQSVDVRLPSGAVVDLHLDPLKLGFPSQFASLVRHHLEPMALDGVTVDTLDPTASLVIALLHLNRNRFRHLSGFADVTRMLSRSEIDWDAFADLLVPDGIEVLVDGSLRAVCGELDLDENVVAGWTSKDVVSRWEPRKIVWNMAWRPSTRLSGLSGRFRMGRRSQFLMPALCRGRSSWVIRWMTRRLFPPPRVLELNHPDVTGPYLIRLIRGRWHQIRHNRFHRAGTKDTGRTADEELANPAD